MIKHPWQNGPTELIKFAIDNIEKDSDFQQRVAYLLFDVGIEVLFKTYLTLPAEITNSKMSFSRRRDAAEGNFHQLVRGVQEAVGDKLEGINLQHIQYFHSVRNKLYHDGDGVTVPITNTYEYGKLAVDLLYRLLGVDLFDHLGQKEDTTINNSLSEIQTIKENIRIKVEDFDGLMEMVLETISPKLVLPSFKQSFDRLVDEYDSRWSDDKCSISSILDYLVFRIEFVKLVVGLIDQAIDNETIKEKIFEIDEYYGDPPILKYQVEKVASDIYETGHRPSIWDIYFRILEIIVNDDRNFIDVLYDEWTNFPEGYYVDYLEESLTDQMEFIHVKEREILLEIKVWKSKLDLWLLQQKVGN